MLRKKIAVLLVGIMSVGFVACGNNTDMKDNTKPNTNINNKDTNKDNMGTNDMMKFEDTDNLKFTKITYEGAETKRDEKLEEAIYTDYGFKKGDEDAMYHYNYIDLNGDGNDEVVVHLTGKYFEDPAKENVIIYSKDGDTYKALTKVKSATTPIIVSKEMSNGYNDLIVKVSGEGKEAKYAHLKYDGKTYPVSPAEAPMFMGSEIEGTAIISDNMTTNKGFDL